MLNRKSKSFTVDGEKFEARELTYASMREMQRVQKEGGDVTGILIVSCIYSADGKPVIESAEDVESIPVRYVEAFADAASEVSGMEKKGSADKAGKTRPRSTRKRG